MLIPKLSIAYETAMLYSFFAIRDPKSKANPEKVVKPPNIPGIKKYFVLSDVIQHERAS